MDPLVFGSLAQIRILLLPVGKTRRTEFEQWATEIRSFDNIRLGDIPADPQEDRARFMPNPLATGHIHLAFPSHPLPSSYAPLSLFRPSDFPLGVIGIATCSQNDSLSSILAHFNAAMSDLFPAGSTYPLASNCFVFEDSDDNTNLNLGNSLSGLVVIPSMMGNKKIYIGTLIADLCSNILGGFATLVQTLETPLGNEYLNASMFPILPAISEFPKPLDNEPLSRSSLPPLPSFNSQPELSTPSNMLRAKTPTPLNLKRNSSTGHSLATSPYRHNSMPTSASKKRHNAIGASSSHGRLFKVLGDLFLLAGRSIDASIWYTEAIATAKGPLDSVWQASALEGLATIPILDAWSSNQNGGTDEKEPWAEIADKLTQAVTLYSKAGASSDPDTTYPLLSYLYTRAILRHASLLYSVLSANGWGPIAFSNMFDSGRRRYLSSRKQRDNGPTLSSLIRSGNATGVHRSEVAAIVAQAHGPWLLHLDSRERISILEAISSVYGSLHYRRKEAYVLREVLGSIMDLVVCGREEAGGSRVNGAGLGLHGVNVGGTTAKGFVGIRENDSTEGNDSVLRIVKYVCRVHGVNLESVKLFDASGRAYSRNREANSGPDSPLDLLDEEEEEILASLDPFGWPELQIGIIREAIAVAEALPDYPSVAQFSLSALKTLHPVMSQGDQHHLFNTAARALATAKRRSDPRTVDYWSGQPIVSLEVLPLPIIRLPIEKPLSVLSQRQSNATPSLTGMTDPFLYNPRKALSGQSQVMLVQNEAFEIVATLKNPYIFDLELSSLSLSTTGVRIESKAMPMIVPANSYHPVTIVGKALEAGTLTIRGCKFQAPGGAAREFVLPLSTQEEEEKRSRRRSALECEAGRSKRAGLESRPWKKTLSRVNNAKTSSTQKSVRFLQCKVVPEQPLLRIRRTSLTHGAVMLYNGEKATFRITLENVTELKIDFLRLTFEDSTIAPAQQALAEGELSVFETYETEYDLMHRPVFTWDSKRHPQEIVPGQKVVVSVHCYGKVGCSSGTIHVSYSYVHRPRHSLQEPAEVFHTRQLSYPVLVTVYHMLECHDLDILPYSPDTLTELLRQYGDGDEASGVKARRELLNIDNDAEWCLFSVETRNTYGLPFEVTFERSQSDAPSASTTTLVAPGSTSRIIIPIRRFLLSDDHVSQAIPTLSDRQFVIAKSNLSSDEERVQRELFWYREELFKFVRGRWKENGGTRSGELSLRKLRLTRTMLDTLRTGTALVYMSLHHYPDGTTNTPVTPIHRQGGKWHPPPNAFIYLRTKVTNLSPCPRVFTVNLNMEPFHHLIYEGVLSDIPVGRLESRESYEFDTPIAFMSSGKFDMTAEVCIPSLPGDKSRFGRGQLKAVVEM